MTIEINDDTKLVRFLDLNGAQKTIGDFKNYSIHSNFRYGLLSEYRKSEGAEGDAKEGSVILNLSGNFKANNSTCNDALISCWAIWDGADNPWESFKESSIANDENRFFAVVSTVGKVKEIFNTTIEICEWSHGGKFHEAKFDYHHGMVEYYSIESGIDHLCWNQNTNPLEYGLGMQTRHLIFHKRDKHEHGKNYAAEKEYRFAMILQPGHILVENKNIKMNTSDILLRDYPLIFEKGFHYIEAVYLLPSSRSLGEENIISKIQASCLCSNIKFRLVEEL